MTGRRPIAVVTGGSAGVGRATALELAARGFDVAILARGRAGLDGAAAELESLGARALAISADVASFEEVDAAASRVEGEFGPIDVWVNNAMTTVFAPLRDVSERDFRRAVEVTFLGQVWGTMAALDRMRPRDRGSIVNIGSALSFIGIPLQAAYCGSKFACRGFFEAARSELVHEHSHVRMSMVHLPAVNTPQFEWCRTVFERHPQPVPPIYEPEVCAKRIVDVALTGERERAIGVWNHLLIGAAALAPGLANRFAALGAWDEQLADRPVQPARPDNLYEPADQGRDYGVHGSFGDVAQGCRTPSFLRSLPTAAANLVRAAGEAAAEHLAAWSHQRTVSDDVPLRLARRERVEPVAASAGPSSDGQRGELSATDPPPSP